MKFKEWVEFNKPIMYSIKKINIQGLTGKNKNHCNEIAFQMETNIDIAQIIFGEFEVVKFFPTHDTIIISIFIPYDKDHKDENKKNNNTYWIAFKFINGFPEYVSGADEHGDPIHTLDKNEAFKFANSDIANNRCPGYIVEKYMYKEDNYAR